MTTVTSALSRAQNLKHATADTHDNVDKSIMAQDPFANTQSYLDFLRLQFYFLKDVSALYEHPELLALIPDLAARRRLGLLEQDFIDLETTIPTPYLMPEVTNKTDVARALGWLYVVEGSKVGAAMLGKQVGAKLNFDAQHGARYLAGPGAGRGSAWRELVQIIDSIELSEQQEQTLIEGARQAFTRFQAFQAYVYS
ncbi:heme oxygenase [Pseudoalteromonas sp. GCY]|uniref:biliverdin-producing heme oxygenase n=1 Tax=Pseudoalteromonas sp. GCY TaxID=2003316 RepID=UPI000BFECAED|nr:biliverdin-producing heme oxygenase [Pseudoalteromonas sp. GCY]PHI35874.1 heme oxygenase [Pseudoalteromonas sp. GCY]QQQ68226.1 biliverdin-producing heme oxygenase [Pseudoalteromonas sp. GCY]